MAKIVETRAINMADCLINGLKQVRHGNVGHDILELAASIDKQGLLQPICVCPAKKEGAFEILIGQRRFAAHQELGREQIMASIFDEEVEEAEAKAISLTENMCRVDMPAKDYIDVCTWLYNRYGSAKAVAEATGLAYDKVRQFVKFDRLKDGLKQLVQEDGVDIKLALRAQDAIEASGDYDKEKAIALANEMNAMSGAQRNKVTQMVEDDPYKPIEDIVEDAKKADDIHQLNIALLPKQRAALEAYKDTEKTNLADAAVTLITEGLTIKGFVDDLD